mgnify:CR=1 FL=1
MQIHDNLCDLVRSARRDRAVGVQQARRRRECDARRRAAELCRSLSESGCSCRETAARLQISRRTLSDWRWQLARNQLTCRPRGRPCKQSPNVVRLAAAEILEEVGPHVGLPALAALLPEMPRCELAELRDDYRRHYRAEHSVSVEQLRWTRAGSVWAVDHYDPPSTIDGAYRAVLAVRDLASGMQLAWAPVADPTAETTAVVLAMLFSEHGAPLVLKSDNGSAFKSELVRSLLDAWGAAPLRSPPRLPRYNGSCEAGIGAMQTRTTFVAAMRGRINHWTTDDLERARREANELYRSPGLAGPTAQEIWNTRTLLSQHDRETIRQAIDRHRKNVLMELRADQAQQPEVSALIHRRAVRRALLECGLLTITRRSITLPIKSKNLAKIT